MNTRSVPSRRALKVLRLALGITLVELMVALAISLIVLFAVTSIYVPTRQNTQLQAGVSRANETAQVVTEQIAREIRQTSHAGCPSVGPITVSNDSLTAVTSVNQFSIAPGTVVRLLASTDSDAPSTAKTGTAVVNLVHAANGGVHLTAKAADRSSAMSVTGDPGFNTSTISSSNSYPIAIISTCSAGEVFQVSNVLQNPWRVVPLDSLRVPYSINARVSPATRTQFFIARYTRPTGERSSWALYRRTMRRDGMNWNSAEPIAHDIVSMDASVQLDTDGDFQADSEAPFGTVFQPAQVVGFLLRFTFETPEGVNGTAGSRVQRTMTSAISIRARVS